MTGYIRQDALNEIDDGQVVKAGPLDSEFDSIVAAFSSSGGHTHSGLTGEGGPISVIGPAQDIVVTTDSMTPKTDNVVSLGSSAFEFKDLWIDGTANIDRLEADVGFVNSIPIVTTTATQSLQNKTFDLTVNSFVATAAQLAAAVTNTTGTGNLTFATSPAFLGVPTAPTAAADTNTTQIATTAHVFAERSNPATLTGKTIDLLNNTLVATSAQIAAAVTDETGTGSLVFSASPALTGVPTAPTAVAGTNTTQIATTAHVFAERSNTATLTNKTISGGTITGITDLAIADGGTGASDAPTARANLGLTIGTNVQAFDAGLNSIAALVTAADTMIYTTALDTYATTGLTAFGRSLIDDANAAAARTTIGLGTIATQAASAVAITGGTITGITDLAIADGGTGASTAAAARTNLGLAIGTDVQAFDAGLNSIAALTTAADTMIYTTALNTYTTTPLTAFGRSLIDDANAAAGRTTLGLGTLSTLSSITTTEIAAATLVTASETIQSNNNDTTLPTSAAVKAYVDTPAYTSTDQTISLNSVLTLAHGLGAKPLRMELVCKCTTADAPFAVGDEVFNPGIHTNGGNVYGCSVSVDGTNAKIRTGSGLYWINDSGTTFTPTLSSWRYVLRLWR